MKLSIIIPVYNGSAYLETCLASILSEMDKNTEVLLIDDGSKDDSFELCKKYQSKQVRVFQNTNHGVSYTRNFGIQKARGTYVMFVDVDDRLESGWQEKVQSVYSKQADIVYFSHRYETDLIDFEAVFENIIGISKKISLPYLASVWSKIFRRDFLLENQIVFDESIINGEDMLFNLQAIVKTKNYCFVKESIYQYRINYQSATHTFQDKIFDSNTRFLEKLHTLLINSSNIDSANQSFYYDFCMIHSIYLFLYRISMLQDRVVQKQKIQVLDSGIYREYLDQHSKFLEGDINLFLKLLKQRKYRISLWLMSFKRRLSFIKKRKVLWEEV